MDANDVDDAVDTLSPSDPYHDAMLGDLLGLLRSRPDARVRHDLEHAAASCRDPSRLDPGTRRFLRTVLDAIHAIIVRGELRSRIEQWSARQAREALAHATRERGVRLSSMAWDAIEAADLDELAFLHGAMCVYSPRWETHHAIRAVIENRALRWL